MVCSTLRPHFTLGKDPVPILQEAGWAPGPVWMGGKSRPNRNSIPYLPARSSVAIPTELPGPHDIVVKSIIEETIMTYLKKKKTELPRLAPIIFQHDAPESMCSGYYVVRDGRN